MPPETNKPLRILLVSDGQCFSIHAGAFQRAFEEQGHTTLALQWKDYFHNYPYAKSQANTAWDRIKSVYYRAQNKFTFGPAMLALNCGLIRQAQAFRPDLIFVYRGTHIWPGTLRKLKQVTGAKIFGYNNDDPFSPQYPRYFWRHFRRGIPCYDHIFAYRAKNIADYTAAGHPHTSILRSYFLKEANRRLTPKPSDTPYNCDVIFIGHFEDDGRDDTIMHLISHGMNVKLFGTLWEGSRHYAALATHMGGDIHPLYGEDYNLALNSAKAALVFLSKLNNDTYTRRCFEIPATGTLMAAEYTDDLANNLYAPETEAIYFTNAPELLSKLQTLLANPKKLESIADTGHARLLRDGHEVSDRARQIIAQYQSEPGR